jgi:hypothetical protein
MGKEIPGDPEEFGSPVTEADIAVSLAEIAREKRRRGRRTA